MNQLVKQLVNDDGEIVEEDEQRWHLMLTSGVEEEHLLCTGEYVGEGCSSGNGEIYIYKEVQRGGITCETCLSIVRTIKGIKL